MFTFLVHVLNLVLGPVLVLVLVLTLALSGRLLHHPLQPPPERPSLNTRSLRAQQRPCGKSDHGHGLEGQHPPAGGAPHALLRHA